MAEWTPIHFGPELSGALHILTGQQVQDGREEGIVLVGQVLHAAGVLDPEADGDGDEEEAAEEARAQTQAQVGAHEQVQEEDRQPAGAHEDGRDQRGVRFAQGEDSKPNHRQVCGWPSLRRQK